MPGRVPTEDGSQEGVVQPVAWPVSPPAGSLATPLAGSPPLKQRGHSRLDVAPAVVRVGTAARCFRRRNAHNRANAAHLAEIAAGPV